MNWDKLDKELTEIVEKRNQLAGMDYNHKDYDDLEEKLHDLEDDFNTNYEDVTVSDTNMTLPHTISL